MSTFRDRKCVFRRRLLSAARAARIGPLETTTTAGPGAGAGRREPALDAGSNPETKLRRAVFPADVQQSLPPEQQDWSSSLDQEDPEPPHIKEEQEEVWTSQEGGQLQGLEEADITKLPFTPVPVKSEDDEEEPQSSQLHQRHTEQMETGADGEDCGGPEPDRNSDPDRHLQPDTEDQNEDSSEPETDDSEDWTETREHRPGLKTLKSNDVPVSGVTGEKPLLLHSCTECGKRFGNKTNLKVHMRTHTGENSFSCLLCGKVFMQGGNLRQHMVVHAGENSLKCSVCSKRFTWYKQFKTHKCGGLQSSQLHERQTKQMKTRADGKDCGGPEPGTRSSRRTTRR